MNKALRYHHARRWGVCDELPAWWNDPFATDGEAAEVPAAQEVVVEDAGPPIVLENPDYESVGDRATAEYEARQTAALERLKARLQTTRRD